MPVINVLPKNISELIAAGEVVERPSAVIKELVENSIDAGATAVTVEIQHGGISYMRVTDNGCGIDYDDVPKAFMRHATSKIKNADDLDSIATLGFRGEALAAISAVSRTEMLTKTRDGQFGTRCVIEGGVNTVLEETGCPEGTTITVRNLFYNTPARMKFLKKDVTEGNAVAAVIDRIALSHPEIAIKFIRDSKQVLTTLGDNNLKNVIYNVLGRDYTASLIPVNSEVGGIKVKGMICKPIYCKQNRNGQFFFLNGRLIRSNTAVAAVEQAYKNTTMVGKFPCCVLDICVPFNTVDVNVHPSKMEVRFSDERAVFTAVYHAVKDGLTQGDTRPQIKTGRPINPYTPQKDMGEQTRIFVDELYKPVKVERTVEKAADENPHLQMRQPTVKMQDGFLTVETDTGIIKNTNREDTYKSENKVGGFLRKPYDEPTLREKYEKTDIAPKVVPTVQENTPDELSVKEDISVKFIGSAFDTYIIVEKNDTVYFIDKHAAHERLLFEKLKNSEKIEVQQLLTPVTVTLTTDEYSAICSNTEELMKNGYEVEDFGNGNVIVRSIPAILKNEDINLLIGAIAEQLCTSETALAERIEDIFHTVACKAAIKGGQHNTDAELKALAERILADNSIMYCPHGRPVAFGISKRELEKQFGRI